MKEDKCNYYIDPNGGSLHDAVKVCCEDDGTTCIEPTQSEIVRKPYYTFMLSISLFVAN